MASNINATKPTTGSPTTQSVRDNFSAAKNEINSLLRSSLDVVTTAGTGTAYTANFSINVVKANGERIILKAHTANTGAPSLNVDNTGAATIKNMDGTNLEAGQIAGPNHYLDLVYNDSNNTWVLMNPTPVKLATSRNIALTGNVTGNASFDGSADISISTALSNASALVAYPIGAVYISVVATSPATLFGGSWLAIGGGRVLQTVSGSTPSAGGNYGSNSRAITTSNMPSHNHDFTDYTFQEAPIHGGNPNIGMDSGKGSGESDNDNYPARPRSATTQNTGNGTNFDVRQASHGVYMWKRTG